jgi:hypothetical protein
MQAKFWSRNLKGRDYSEDLRRRWEDNIRMELREIGWEGEDWMNFLRIRTRGVLL